MTPHAPSPFGILTEEQLRQRRSLKWRGLEPDMLPLWVAEMDAPLAAPVERALIEAVLRGDTGYADAGGLPEAFAGFAERRFGWTVDAGSLMLIADIITGVEVALQTVTVPGDSVVISTPVYGPYFHHIELLGRKVISSPLSYDSGAYRLDLDRLAQDFARGARAYVLCNPHNPTGLVFSRDQLQQIGRLADEFGVAVIADEVFAPLTAPGVVHVPFATIDAEAAARGFSVQGASKAWNLAGLKAALLCPGPQADRSRMRQELTVGASMLGVLASEAAFNDGEEWLDQVRAGIAERSNLLSCLLARSLPTVRYQPPAGTYLAWLNLRACGVGDDPAAVLQERGRVALYSGLYFGAEGRGFARLNLATSRAILTEAVARMSRVLVVQGSSSQW